jgi:hypothetical protein
LRLKYLTLPFRVFLQISFQKDYSAVVEGISLSLIRPATKIPTTTAPAVHNIPLTLEFIIMNLSVIQLIFIDLSKEANFDNKYR